MAGEVRGFVSDAGGNGVVETEVLFFQEFQEPLDIAPELYTPA